MVDFRYVPTAVVEYLQIIGPIKGIFAQFWSHLFNLVHRRADGLLGQKVKRQGHRR